MTSSIYIPCFIAIIITTPISTYFANAESRKELRNKDVSDGKIVQWRTSIRSTDRIDPSRVVQISWRPRVFMYKGLLRDEECDLFVSLIQAKEEQSVANSGDVSKTMKRWQLAGTESTLNDSILGRIEERVSTWTLLPQQNGKPLEVIHSGVEETKGDLDYFGNKSASIHNEQLMATVVLYLSNVTRGGQILFPQSEVGNQMLLDCTASHNNILRPIKGNAILFFHVHLSASPDASSTHARCPVLEGEMWYATKSFLIRPIKKGEQLSESTDGECNDEDTSCPEWAAMGECQRNPVFMVGSPDYYGTCRKSCNAC